MSYQGHCEVLYSFPEIGLIGGRGGKKNHEFTLKFESACVG